MEDTSIPMFARPVVGSDEASLEGRCHPDKKSNRMARYRWESEEAEPEQAEAFCRERASSYGKMGGVS